jgi:ribonucleoside-diphosphate reductase alpha chain
MQTSDDNVVQFPGNARRREKGLRRLQMLYAWQMQLVDDRELYTNAMKVGVMLSWHMMDEGELGIAMSQASIAENANMPPETAYHAVCLLERRGHMKSFRDGTNAIFYFPIIWGVTDRLLGCEVTSQSYGWSGVDRDGCNHIEREMSNKINNDRRRLPNRRGHELMSFTHNGRPFTLGIGRFNDGRIAEIFINVSGRAGSEVEVLARDGAICASLGLQYGIPLDELRRSLMRTPNGAAPGVLGAALDMLAAETEAEVA